MNCWQWHQMVQPRDSLGFPLSGGGGALGVRASLNGEDDDEDGEESESSTHRIARTYPQLARRSSPNVAFVGPKHLKTLMQALGECSHTCQVAICTQLEALTMALVQSGQVKAVMLTHHIMYDETPLRM